MKNWIFPLLLLLGIAVKSQETRIKLYPNTSLAFEHMYGVNVGFSFFPDKPMQNKIFNSEQYLNIELHTTFGRYGEWNAEYQKYIGANLEFHYAIEFIRFFTYMGVIGINNENSFFSYAIDDVTYDPGTDSYIYSYSERGQNQFWNPSAFFSGGVGVELKSREGNVLLRGSMGFPQILNLGVGIAI